MRGTVPRSPPRRDSRSPPWDPRTRAETSATSAERRRTRPSHRATRAPVGVHTTPWLFTPPTQRQRSRALLTQRDRHPRAVPTARPEGRRATHASDPPQHPNHTGYQRGTAPEPAVVLLTSTSTQYNHRTASLPEALPQYIHSVQSSQQPLRLRAGGWATNGRLLRTPLRTHGM